MAVNPIQDILQMLMQQGGVGNMPAMQPGAQQAGIAPISPQSQGMGTGGTMPDPGQFMPPDMPPPRQMAALSPSGGMPDQATPAQISESENMESYGDPRFGPRDDQLRQETEDEIEATGDQIRAGGEGDPEANADWEGTRVPTAADLEYVKEHPTDGVLNSFFDQFPEWTAQDILMSGGNPSTSPDQYAMDDDEWEALQADRSTRIDER